MYLDLVNLKKNISISIYTPYTKDIHNVKVLLKLHALGHPLYKYVFMDYFLQNKKLFKFYYCILKSIVWDFIILVIQYSINNIKADDTFTAHIE